MKINAINSVYSNQQTRGIKTKTAHANNVPVASTPAFKGDVGRGVGSVLGFAASYAGLVGLAALGIACPIAPIVAVALGAKAGGDALSNWEDKQDSNNSGKNS